jgi:Xaa-Pro aminopeptidase
MVNPARLQQLFAKHHLSQFLVTNPVNTFYLSGLQSTNALMLLKGDEMHIFTDPRYEVEAALLSGVNVHIGRDLISLVSSLIADSETLHVDESLRFMHATKIQELKPGTTLETKSNIIEELRTIKSSEELLRIQHACEITSEVWRLLINEQFIGRTEIHIARRIQSLILELGGDGIAFDSIVAAGVNSASPHHTPSEYVIQRGDFIKCDFGAKIAGYHSDMTRMAIAGKPFAWQQEIYDVVKKAQEAGVSAIQQGVSSEIIDAAARSVINEANYGDAFTHPSGHGIGLEIHEIPIHGSRDVTLCPSMTLTVEPGIYLHGKGGVRLEDTLVVLEQGSQNLTMASKALAEVE